MLGALKPLLFPKQCWHIVLVPNPGQHATLASANSLVYRYVPQLMAVLTVTACDYAVASAVVSVGEYTVSIITDPWQGPFRIGQEVQFSCQVEPTPFGTVRYNWRNVDDVYGYFYENRQNYTHHYDYYNSPLRYCYYFCEVSVNGTLIGSARRIVHVQGELVGVMI